MQVPSWLTQASGAQAFANNPANGFQPTMGDVAQGIGHSMMQHYRRADGQPEAQAQGAAPAPAAMAQPGMQFGIKPDGTMGLVAPPPPPVAQGGAMGSMSGMLSKIDPQMLASILGG